MRKKKLLKAIAKWIELNNQLREINSYLYNHTELFEAERIDEYNEELFNFFAGKITRFTKDENELYNRMSGKDIILMKEMILFGGV